MHDDDDRDDDDDDGEDVVKQQTKRFHKVVNHLHRPMGQIGGGGYDAVRLRLSGGLFSGFAQNKLLNRFATPWKGVSIRGTPLVNTFGGIRSARRHTKII